MASFPLTNIRAWALKIKRIVPWDSCFDSRPHVLDRRWRLRLPLRCSAPAGWESGPDRWGFLSTPSFPARWGGRAPRAPDRARSPAEPPSWEGWRPAGCGVRGTGAPLWLWGRCGCFKKKKHTHKKNRDQIRQVDKWRWEIKPGLNFKSDIFFFALSFHLNYIRETSSALDRLTAAIQDGGLCILMETLTRCITQKSLTSILMGHGA